MNGFCPLASGSKGNSIFLGTDTTRILIDAGIRASALVKKLAEIDIELTTIQAILVTHEHTDHILGIATLAEKYKIPVFANADTAKAMCQILGMRPKFKIFATGEPFIFGDLEISSFSVPHDTVDPVAFVIQTGSFKLGFCTDLGHATSYVKKNLEGCDYLYVEANHHPPMVHACNRPAVYKQRVLSRQGHLSNEQCANLLISLFNKNLKHIHLAHLSAECNSKELALKMIQEALLPFKKSLDISVAYQDQISKAVYF